MLGIALIMSVSPSLVLADTKGTIQGGINEANGGTQPDNGDLSDTVKTVVNILSVAAGIVAVIMIIIGGFRYVTSGGKQESVASAKNTILYAIIGLVVVALAQVIVRFVLFHTINPSTPVTKTKATSQSSGNSGSTTGGLTGQSSPTGNAKSGGLQGASQ